MISDADRIDWLESNAGSRCVEPRVEVIIAGRHFVQGEDLRAWIDSFLNPPTTPSAQETSR